MRVAQPHALAAPGPVELLDAGARGRREALELFPRRDQEAGADEGRRGARSHHDGVGQGACGAEEAALGALARLEEAEIGEETFGLQRIGLFEEQPAQRVGADDRLGQLERRLGRGELDDLHRWLQNSCRPAALSPELLADQIVFAIDQPWGVSISDLTVRASGDGYML